jgi:uncharacterized protein YbaP (TraB family)
VESLADDLLQGLAEFPALYQSLVVERNRNWAEQLSAMATGSNHSALVVVGTLHLVGDDSLVALLRKRGFTVSRLGDH